jgi:hypothetical protein
MILTYILEYVNGGRKTDRKIYLSGDFKKGSINEEARNQFLFLAAKRVRNYIGNLTYL